MNKEGDREIDEKSKQREKGHEAYMWNIVYRQEECGDGKKGERREKERQGKEEGDINKEIYGKI